MEPIPYNSSFDDDQRQLIIKDSTERLAREYLDVKKFADSVAKRVEELKHTLTAMVISKGKPDDKGNLWCPAGVYQLKRERRISDSFDAKAAAAWAKENGYWDQVKEVVEVLDEDKLLALGWENADVANVMPSFYNQKETWAFKVVEAKSYDDE